MLHQPPCPRLDCETTAPGKSISDVRRATAAMRASRVLKAVTSRLHANDAYLRFGKSPLQQGIECR